MTTETIRVPDIGDFGEVPIIDILIAEGQELSAEDPLITLESDKATMDIPAPKGGKVSKILVAEGDSVKEGDAICEIEVFDASGKAEEKSEKPEKEPKQTDQEHAAPANAPSTESTKTSPVKKGDVHADVVVLGSGPGGYTAAFRAADLGLNVVLIERYDTLGGVCLNVGCIPSKALLHTAEVITEVQSMPDHGVTFGEPKIDIDKLRGFKDSVVKKLTGGLASMGKQRGVSVLTGVGCFVGPNAIEVKASDKTTTVSFDKAIIAAGSQAVKLPGLPWDDDRLMDSTDALELKDIPKRLLVIGGGIIGMEMASVYHALGSEVTVCEMLDQLMPGADKDLVKPFQRFVSKRYKAIYTSSKVTRVEAQKSGLKAWFEGSKTPESESFDRILVAVGRSPNGKNIGADKAGVEVSDRGFISVDNRMRTNVDHIFAIGDIVGQPMLAHKATHEAKVAAEVCAGEKSAFDARVIPSVAYTDPEVAWVGVTEQEAKDKGLSYGTGVFPWAASGRALGLDRSEGMTKLIFDEKTERLLGAGIVGPHAGDLIAECALAIEMGANATDIGLTIHPHPTLSESVGMAAEAFEGTITDLYLPKKQKKAD